MKKKMIIIIFIVLIIAIFITYRGCHNTPLYIGLAGDSQYDKVDIQIKLDNKEVFNDTIHYTYHSFYYTKIDLPLNNGLHNIVVSSNLANLKDSLQIILEPNQYIIVEFYSKTEFIRDSPEFRIQNLFRPFTFD